MIDLNKNYNPINDPEMIEKACLRQLDLKDQRKKIPVSQYFLPSYESFRDQTGMVEE